MEETQNQEQTFQQPQETKVSFPTVGEQKKNGGAKTLLIVGILVLVGILGYVIYKSASGNSEENSVSEPTPYENMVAPEEVETPSATATPTASPAANIDKAKIKIQVQNGTGITGEAAYLQNILKSLGYTDVSVGNSATQNEEDATVSFGSSVAASVVTEITNKLNTTYETVTKKTSTSSAYDIVIVTGLRKGATPKATAASTTTPTATPTATPTKTP